MGDYSLAEVARIFDLSPARLRYWQRTELLSEPSAPPAFGYGDLVCVRGLVRLLDGGMPLRRIRDTVRVVRRHLPEVERPLDAMRVWPEGSMRVVVRSGDRWFEPDGQLVLDQPPAPAQGSPVELPRNPTDPDAALRWFEEGCRLDAHPDTWDEAVRAYESAITEDPAFADAYCNLGSLLYQQGRKDRARELYERALEVETDHVEARFNLANVLEEEGRDEGALHHYKRAMRLDPTSPEIQLNLALLYEKLGLGANARRHWRRYLGLCPTGTWAEVARDRVEPKP